MIQAATKYADVRTSGRRSGTLSTARRAAPALADKRPSIFIPNLLNFPQQMEAWYFKAIREGGELFEYIRREKATSKRRMRAIARLMHGRKQNPKSELRLKAAVPAREFWRWQKEEPGCWSDDDFIRRMARSEPDMVAPR